MANTHDYSIANATGSAVRTDLNTLFTEIEAANAGASAPTNLATGKLWYDTGNNLLKQYDGSSWVTIMDSTGGTFTGAVTLPSPVINTGVSGTAIKDEDAMGSNSATHLATQQSIKAYVDSAASQATTAAQGVGTGNTPEFAGVKITASGGINFSAYATSGNPSSNLLDDYEEGTWAPAMIAITGTFAGYTISSATYTKIGRMVAIEAKCYPNTIGTGSAGFTLTNLPFTSSPTNAFAITGINLSAQTDFIGYIEASGTTMRFPATMGNLHSYVINGTYSVS